LWYYYGSLPFIVIGAIAGLVAIGIVYSSRKAKHAKEQAEARKTFSALEQRLKEEQFEREQQAKGLTKYVDKDGNTRWGTQDEVAEWARADKAQVEVIIQKQVVKIRCPYCGQLYDEHLSTCPHCGGSR
jgi:type II secretory pathway pseudopilin PulG